MFDRESVLVALPAGEADLTSAWDDDGFDDWLFLLTVDELNTGWVDDDRQVLPPGLEDWVPGPFLAAVVSGIDVSRLNGHDAVRLMRAQARLAAHHEAGKYESMAEVAYSPPGDADSAVERDVCEIDFVEAEIAAALTLTRRASQTELERAVSLSGKLCRVREAFSEGGIDSHKVRVFDSQLRHLPQETVDVVLDQILGDAAGLTTGQLRARLARMVLQADPDGAASSFQEGLRERKVTTDANPDQTANFSIRSAHPLSVAKARNHVETLAREIKARCGNGRSLDEIRTDVALDLLQGKCSCDGTRLGDGGRVNITVAADTLAGITDQPGDIGGYGPVFAEIARKTVMENIDGEWTFCVTDNGRPVATGTLGRRPTAGQRRQVAAVYAKCTAPGCREDAWDCDMDHRHPYADGGRTCINNLAPLCRYHHRVKTEAGWQLKRLDNGDHQWTSPLGHTYLRKRGPPR
jgi:hypothetical protein